MTRDILLTSRNIQQEGRSELSQLRIQGGGQRGQCPPPVLVKTSHKKDGRHWQLLIFHVSCPPPTPLDHPGSDAVS